MTADIVSIASRRPGDMPDPRFVSQDQWGRRMHLWRGEYKLGGRTWTADYWAFDTEDGVERGELLGLDNCGMVVEEGEW